MPTAAPFRPFETLLAQDRALELLQKAVAAATNRSKELSNG